MEDGTATRTACCARDNLSLLFVLDALLDTPEVDTGAVERAVEFIKAQHQ